MNNDPTSSQELTYTAFAAGKRLAHGSLAEIGQALSATNLGDASVLVFNDLTCEPVDTPPSADQLAKMSANALRVTPGSMEPASPPAVGRPRLGVVAREVTLLPRHWQWLSAQQGGASAALRRLVDEARRTHADRDMQRAATERAYRFMSAIAGHEVGFEEASRALFAYDEAGFLARTESWPPDVRKHLLSLTQNAFKNEARP